MILHKNVRTHICEREKERERVRERKNSLIEAGSPAAFDRNNPVATRGGKSSKKTNPNPEKPIKG